MMFHVLHGNVSAEYLVYVKSSRGLLTEVLEVLLLALALYIVINFAVQTVHVIGISMAPTVQDQDYLVATKFDYRLHSPQRGDIIIMRDPYDSSRDFIKRVIATPGDQVLIREGHVYLNGHLLNEPYVNEEPWVTNANWPAPAISDPGGKLMTADDYFVMGDNRNHSSDSRLFGPIHRDQIEARAWVRVLPVTKLGSVNAQKPRLVSAALLPAPA